MLNNPLHRLRIASWAEQKNWSWLDRCDFKMTEIDTKSCKVFHIQDISLREATGTSKFSDLNVFDNAKKFSLISSIGLVKVDRDIIFNQNVQPIALNRRNIRFPTAAILSGFGHYSMDLEEIRASEHLQFKNTTILTSFDCTARTALTGVVVPDYRPIIYPGHICTLVQRGIGGCFGDSGSPLVANGGIVGVVSFGLSCARGAPDILARVSHYLGWIDSHIRS